VSIAVCPGSFDPITNGHLDIIRRAAGLFDRVVVLAAVNPNKNYAFSIEERCEMIRLCVSDLENVEVEIARGLLVDDVRRLSACAIVKGLRAVSDFEYEFQQALVNKKLYPEADTVFLTTSPENMFLSSSIVKQVAAFEGEIADFVPKPALEAIQSRLK
jgi:pantetheine-phosphate adenylyltransferase